MNIIKERAFKRTLSGKPFSKLSEIGIQKHILINMSEARAAGVLNPIHAFVILGDSPFEVEEFRIIYRKQSLNGNGYYYLLRSQEREYEYITMYGKDIIKYGRRLE